MARGCFADSYDWKDGVGPAEKRPRRTNFWAGDPLVRDQGNIPQKYDPNEFGTNEFVQFCKLAGSQPYMAANLRSLPATEFYRWVEYCNSPTGSTTLADLRASTGSKEPFGVRYWGIGNESWGCGGEMTPGEYATEFRRFAAWVPRYGEDLSFIASGPNDAEFSWTRGFFQGMLQKGPNALNSIWGLSLHYYSWNLSRGKTRNWIEGKGDAVKFDTVDWYELMKEAEVLETLIEGHWQAMGEADPKRRIKLVVDEWGPWYKPGSEVAPTHSGPDDHSAGCGDERSDAGYFQSPSGQGHHGELRATHQLPEQFVPRSRGSLRDYAGVSRVPDVRGAPGRAGRARGIFVSFDQLRSRWQAGNFLELEGIGIAAGKDLAITVVNPDVSQPRETEISLLGGEAVSGRATVLTNTDIHAHNTFDAPDVVRPRSEDWKPGGRNVHYAFAPASVTLLEIKLR